MAKAKFYIRFHSYWENAQDFFAGPFDSKQEAEADIERANRAEQPSVNFVRGDLGQMAPNVKDDIRVAGILTTTQARAAGMRHIWNNDPAEKNLVDRLMTTMQAVDTISY